MCKFLRHIQTTTSHTRSEPNLPIAVLTGEPRGVSRDPKTNETSMASRTHDLLYTTSRSVFTVFMIVARYSEDHAVISIFYEDRHFFSKDQYRAADHTLGNSDQHNFFLHTSYYGDLFRRVLPQLQAIFQYIKPTLCACFLCINSY
jgi:hypothetical protein